MRVDLVLAEHAFGSKKTIKRLFQRRVVKVDGSVITEGSFNVERQLHQLTVEGKTVSIPKHYYFGKL